jgi:hypothetical protein
MGNKTLNYHPVVFLHVHLSGSCSGVSDQSERENRHMNVTNVNVNVRVNFGDEIIMYISSPGLIMPTDSVTS